MDFVNSFVYKIPMQNQSTADRVLVALKLKGPQTAREIADAFGLSVMGAHKVLGGLGEAGLVHFEDVATGRGRPRRLFALTEAGHRRFPDRHAELNAELIETIRASFGEEGLDRLVGTRAARQGARYAGLCGETLAQKVAGLADLRSADGYMARSETLESGACRLIENHCPICAAAETYDGFCRAELDTFRTLFGSDAEVTREEHLMAGGRRCTYRIATRKTG